MKVNGLILLSLFLSFGLRASEKNIYFLLHGLYSSNYHWDYFLNSKEFKKSEFSYGGNFFVTEDFFTSNKFLISPEFDKELEEILDADNLVFTINFASGFQHDFWQQALQIRNVLELFPNQKVNYYLVAHSMGGLAARSYLTSNPNRKISGLVTIGTPNLGSYLGNSDTTLTGLLGILTGVFKRPDNLLTGISRIWKEKRRNVTPALAPDSADLTELNQKAFPEDVKTLCIFSAINTPEEIEALSGDEQFVHQILQMEKLKSFQATNPLDVEITTLYNDLYYNDGLVSIASQNINNAIPNKYQVQVHHIPSRIYHDNEPKDVEHIIPAMRIIKNTKRPKPYNLFIYSTTEEIIRQDYFSSISQAFFNISSYDATFVIDKDDKLIPIHLSQSPLLFDYGIFLINSTEKLNDVHSRIDSTWIKPILVDFSINNNIKKFEDKDCIYIKVVTVEEAEQFFKFLSDVLSGKIHVLEGELDKVKEQIIRYYFPTSNMTERLKIPDAWWKDRLIQKIR